MRRNGLVDVSITMLSTILMRIIDLTPLATIIRLDEGIAIYFIVRKLGEELIKSSKVDQERLIAIS